MLGVGAVLSVEREGEEFSVAYLSKILAAAERNYSASEMECLAVVKAVDHFAIHLLGQVDGCTNLLFNVSFWARASKNLFNVSLWACASTYLFNVSFCARASKNLLFNVCGSFIYTHKRKRKM